MPQSSALQFVSVSLLGRAVSGSVLISFRDRHCCSLRRFALQISSFESIVLFLVLFKFLSIFSRPLSSCAGHGLKQTIASTLPAELNERA